MKRSKRKCWLNVILRCVLLVCSYFMATCLQAGPINKLVTLTWQHGAGPYSYNVYETTNLPSMHQALELKTNVPDLSVHLEVEPGEHFFSVTCVDTNTGLESPFAVP